MFEIAKIILKDADVAISEDRVKDYGDPKICFRTLSEMWTSYTGHPITPNDVAMMMVLLKVVRNKHHVKLDNLVDICGYAALAGELTLADEPFYVPTIPLSNTEEPGSKDFEQEPEDSEWEPEPGELIEVRSNYFKDHWVTRVFVGRDETGWFLCRNQENPDDPPVAWRLARKLQMVVLDETGVIVDHE